MIFLHSIFNKPPILMEITSLQPILMPGIQLAPKTWQTGFLEKNAITGTRFIIRAKIRYYVFQETLSHSLSRINKLKRMEQQNLYM